MRRTLSCSRPRGRWRSCSRSARAAASPIRHCILDLGRVLPERLDQHRVFAALASAAAVPVDDPGAVLVGPALGHLSFAEGIGAYHAAAAPLIALGLSGWVRR